MVQCCPGMRVVKSQGNSGYTMVEVMIVVSVIGMLAALAIPAFARSRAVSRANACINNLRQIDAAKDQWAMENNKSDSDGVISANVEPYLKEGMMSGLVCPAGGFYSLSTVASNPVCSLGGGHAL